MKNNEKEFLVLGLGRMSSSVVETLVTEDCNVTVVDENKDKIELVASKVSKAVIGDVTELNVLKSLDVPSYDYVIVGIGTNLEASLMCCMTLKDLGAKCIIAKAKSIHHKIVLDKIGVDKVVLPEKEMGARIAFNLINSNKLDLVQYSTDYQIAELEPKSEWIGKNLIELNLRRSHGMNIIAIKKGGEHSRVNVSPTPDYVIKSDDTLVVIVPSSNYDK